MKQPIYQQKYRRKSLIFGVLTILSIMIYSYLYHLGVGKSAEEQFQDYQQEFLKREQLFNEYFHQLINNNNIKNVTELLHFCKEKNVNDDNYTFAINQNEHWIAWSNNKVFFPSQLNTKDSVILSNISNKWLLLTHTTIDDKIYVGSISLQHLDKKTPFGYLAEYDIFSVEDTQGQLIYNNNGQPMFRLLVSPIVLPFDLAFLVLLSFLLLFVFLCYTIANILLQIPFVNKYQSCIFYSIVFIGLIFLILFDYHIKIKSDLLSPLYYSSHYNSLGSLIVHVFIMFLGAIFYQQYYKFYYVVKKTKKTKIAVAFLLLTVNIIYSIYLIQVINGALNDSMVVLRPEGLYNYTPISISILTSVVFACYIIIITLKKTFSVVEQLVSDKQIIAIMLIAIYSLLIGSFIIYFVATNKFTQYIDKIGIVIVFQLYYLLPLFYPKLKKRKDVAIFGYALATILILVLAIVPMDERKEHYKESIAQKLLSGEDLYEYYDFSELAEQLKQDTNIGNFFDEKKLNGKFDMKYYVMQRYLKDYVNHFDINLLCYINEIDESLDLNRLMNKYAIKDKISSLEGLSFRQMGIGSSEYIINTSIEKDEEQIGQLFILFKRTLQNTSSPVHNANTNYSYAGYRNGKLEMNVANYDLEYNYNLSDYNLDTIYSGMSFQRDGYIHTIYTNDDWLVIISSQNTIFWGRLSLLMVIVLIFLITAIVPIIMAIPIKKAFRFPSVKTMLNIFIVTLIFTMIVFAIVFFVRFSKTVRNEEQYQNQSNRIKEIINIIASSTDIEQAQNVDKTMVNKIENVLNSYFDMDYFNISIYDKYGRCVQNFGKGVFLIPQLNPHVYNTFIENNLSIWFTTEYLYGKRYRCAYHSLVNQKGEIIGYVKLPQLAYSIFNLNDEHQSQLVTRFFCLIFLFVFIIFTLFTIVLQWYLNPLMRVTKRLSEINFVNSPIDNPLETISSKRKDEFGKLVDNYNTLVIRLEESAQILKQNSQREAWQNMARQVAHEIKNPLTPMQLKTQFILREYNSGNVSQQKMNTYFATMLEQINSLSEIASSFSQLSQIGSSDSDVEDLIIIINNVLALYQNTEDVEISFIHNLQENQAFVFINKTQLIRVFNNLIKNSIQAKKDNEDNFVKIILKSSQDNKMWQIDVVDNGIGIADEDKRKVFTSNFTTKMSGSGIGLYMVKNILQCWGGDIVFESVLGEGSTFTILLPKWQEDKK